MSCKRRCLWNYNGDCVTESPEEVYDDDSFMTDNCIGFLREDFEEHMVEMKSILMSHSNNKLMEGYIKNLSYVGTKRFYKNFISLVQNEPDTYKHAIQNLDEYMKLL